MVISSDPCSRWQCNNNNKPQICVRVLVVGSPRLYRPLFANPIQKTTATANGDGNATKKNHGKS